MRATGTEQAKVWAGLQCALRDLGRAASTGGQPSMGNPIGLHPMKLPATPCSDGSTELRVLPAFPW